MSRDNNVYNDCVAIISWFYRNQGKHINLSQCGRDIGMSRTVISRYLNAPTIHDDWFLYRVGLSIGYEVIYTGRAGEYIWVRKLNDRNL